MDSPLSRAMVRDAKAYGGVAATAARTRRPRRLAAHRCMFLPAAADAAREHQLQAMGFLSPALRRTGRQHQRGRVGNQRRRSGHGGFRSGRFPNGGKRPRNQPRRRQRYFNDADHPTPPARRIAVRLTGESSATSARSPRVDDVAGRIAAEGDATDVRIDPTAPWHRRRCCRYRRHGARRGRRGCAPARRS